MNRKRVKAILPKSFNKLIKSVSPKTEFAKGVSVLVGGTATAQALTIAAMPLITRLYHPEDFGLLTLFTALLSIFAVISSLRYELAIPISDSNKEASRVLFLAVFFTISQSIIIALLIYFFSDKISSLLNSKPIEKYLWILPIAVFFTGSYQIFEKWSIREKKFKRIAKTKLSQVVAGLTIQLTGYPHGSLALIIGQAVSQAVGVYSLLRSAIQSIDKNDLTIGSLKETAKRYKGFPLYSTWTALSNTISTQLAPIIFIAIFSPEIAGLYALTLRVLSVPTSIIGSTVGQVFLSLAPAAARTKELPELIASLHAKLSRAGIPILILLLIAGPDLFTFVFGEAWRRAGVYAQIMAPWIYLQFKWTPLSMISTVLELQRQALIAQFLSLLTRGIILLFISINNLSPINAILLFSITSAINYLTISLWFFRQANLSPFKILFGDIVLISGFTTLALPSLILSRYGSIGVVTALMYYIALSFIWLSWTQLTTSFLDRWLLKTRYIYNYPIKKESITHSIQTFDLINSLPAHLLEIATDRLKHYIKIRSNSPNWIIFLCVKNNEIIGYSFLHTPSSIEWNDSLPTLSGEARESSTYVEPTHRGKGIRSMLLAAQVNYCNQQNKTMWAVIEKSNSSSIKSTERFGAIRIRTNYLIKIIGRNFLSILSGPLSFYLIDKSKRQRL